MGIQNTRLIWAPVTGPASAIVAELNGVNREYGLTPQELAAQAFYFTFAFSAATSACNWAISAAWAAICWSCVWIAFEKYGSRSLALLEGLSAI
jgi:hypothetical protein